LINFLANADQALTLAENVAPYNDDINYSEEEKTIFSNISIDDL
jgi:hypothetical protein